MLVSKFQFLFHNKMFLSFIQSSFTAGVWLVDSHLT